MILLEHINYLEKHLLHSSEIAAISGHPLHKGTPREAFIKDFLVNHLPEFIGYGSGEIIDHKSRPGETRNQIDIVLYRKNYPKIYFGGGINAFLVESVASTIEVKSTLTKEDLFASFDAIRNIRLLDRNINVGFTVGYQPPGILTVVVAYDGPKKMSTVHGWINEYVQEKKIQYPDMPHTIDARVKLQSPIADLIVVLGKGFIQFDNSPVTVINDNQRKEIESGRWVLSDEESGNLLMLFSQMTLVLSSISASWINLNPYLSNFTLKDVNFIP
jgi:hypothetical protein